MIHIVYDNIIYSLQKAGGITTYWKEICQRIEKKASVIYLNGNKRNRYNKLSVKSANDFIFHSSYYRICRNKNAINVTTVHDFTYEYYRKDLFSIIHKIQKKYAVMHSSGIICVSDNTKKDLLRFYPSYKGKIKVIYHGFSSDFIFKNECRENICLFVGSRTKYKNFELAVDLIKSICDMKLVIIGGGELEESEKLFLNKNIPQKYEKIGYISNSELAKYYNKAICLLYTSNYEGFGIPILEAQACGCVVVCQNISSIPEVVGNSGIIINKNDLFETAKIIKTLMNKDILKTYQNKGFANIKRFSWDKCAEETLAFYNDVYDEWVKK